MAETARQARQRELLPAATPWVFVLIWNTGFDVARTATPHSPPLTFPSRRYVVSLLALGRLLAVVWPRLGGGEVTTSNFGLSVPALLSNTVGTPHQKRHATPADVRCANSVPIGAACVIALPAAVPEPSTPQWHAELVDALVRSVLGLTLGGSSLLMLLIQSGAATRVASRLHLAATDAARCWRGGWSARR